MEEQQRTSSQNRAAHKYFGLVAEALNDAGLSIQQTLKSNVDVPWTPVSVKEILFRSVMRAMFLKDSTTELTTAEVNKVYEVMDRHLSQLGLDSIPFPSTNPIDLLRD